jgi:hypothetical protein
MLYQALLNPCLYVAEKKHSYFSLSEKHLQAIWSAQKYLNPLITEAGELIAILSPGIWNQEAGPDFLKAHIKVGDQELRGDIEIHFDDEGWYQHHHHLDQNYNRVVLHLSFSKTQKSKTIFKQNGESPLQVYLAPSLTIDPVDLVNLVDLELFPYKTFSHPGRCAGEIFAKWPRSHIEKLFRSAAKWRLKQKAFFLKEKIKNPTWLAAGGMAMALGYKNNVESFQYRQLRKEFFAAIPTYLDSYWNHHYTFEPKKQMRFLSLLGDDVKQAMLINTFFPLLFADLEEQEAESEEFNHFYRRFDSPPTNKNRYLRYRFFDQTGQEELMDKAIIEQGAYQIHHDFCLHFEASCQGCPFVQRLQTVWTYS